VTLVANFFATVFGGVALASKDVLAKSYSLNMLRIHAGTIPTEMIDCVPLGDWSFESHVTRTVGAYLLTLKVH
jgi:hypothetical protein